MKVRVFGTQCKNYYLQAADFLISYKCVIPGQSWNRLLQEEWSNRRLSISNTKETCVRESIHGPKTKS